MLHLLGKRRGAFCDPSVHFLFRVPWPISVGWDSEVWMGRLLERWGQRPGSAGAAPTAVSARAQGWGRGALCWQGDAFNGSLSFPHDNHHTGLGVGCVCGVFSSSEHHVVPYPGAQDLHCPLVQCA